MSHHLIDKQANGPMDLAILKNQFDEVWWQDFMHQTNNMTATSTISNGLNPEQVKIMRRHVLDILAEVGQLHQEKYGYRLWIDGQQVEDLSPHFALHPMPNEDVETWVRRAFGDQKFGIILNRGEKFSSKLSQAAAVILEPILKMIGMPTEGILFTIFIGNYDMTPLGIHKDFAGKSGMHFHLGPGPKTMYVWEDDDYKTAPGEKRCNNMNVGPHLSTADKHTFQQGQFYFMPENKFHLGMQNELSIGLACWFYNRCDYDFAGELINRFKAYHLKKSEGMLKSDKNPVDDTSAVEPVLSLFTLEGREDVGVKPLLREIYRDFRYSLFSNAGYRNRPVARATDVDIHPEDAVHTDEPYKMLCRADVRPCHYDVFVRGTKVSLRNFAGLERIVDLLNSGKTVTVDQMISLLDDPLAAQKVRYLLKVLHKYCGISVIPRCAGEAVAPLDQECKRLTVAET
jgi:hypothetical protein